MDWDQILIYLTPVISSLTVGLVARMFKVQVSQKLLQDAILIIIRIIREARKVEQQRAQAVGDTNHPEHIIMRSTALSESVLNSRQKRAIKDKFGSLKDAVETLMESPAIV